jgi:uncharacterized protein YjbI with pentapeptide repeats
MYEILNRYTKAVLYKSDTATDARECLIEAVSSGANLSGANLSGANLSGAYLRDAYLSGANLSGANLSGANLRDANLSGANLSDANLSGANLSGANLSDANLSGANLSGANLSDANLSGAVGVNKFLASPLHMLRDQPGKIRAYKITKPDGSGIHYPGFICEVGAVLETKANTDENIDCAPGVNVATLDWCLREYQEGRRIWVIEFEAADIAAIPLGTDGKFRLHRCTVVAEKTLAEVGLEETKVTV